MRALFAWVMLRVNRFRFRRRLRKPFRTIGDFSRKRRTLPRWIRMSLPARLLRRAMFRIKIGTWFWYFQLKHKLTDVAAAQAIGISIQEYRGICWLRTELYAPAWFGFCKAYDLDPNFVSGLLPYSRFWKPILPHEETSRLMEEYTAELASKRREERRPNWLAMGLKFNLRSRRAGEYETTSESQR
jgi:hypothetical protein